MPPVRDSPAEILCLGPRQGLIELLTRRACTLSFQIKNRFPIDTAGNPLVPFLPCPDHGVWKHSKEVRPHETPSGGSIIWKQRRGRLMHYAKPGAVYLAGSLHVSPCFWSFVSIRRRLLFVRRLQAKAPYKEVLPIR